MIITLVSMLASSMPSLMPEYPTINRNTADQQALVVKPSNMLIQHLRSQRRQQIVMSP